MGIFVKQLNQFYTHVSHQNHVRFHSSWSQLTLVSLKAFLCEKCALAYILQISL